MHRIYSIWKLKKNNFHKDSLYYLVFFLIALSLVLDFFSPGYILTLDMIFSDRGFHVSNLFYGLSNSYSITPFIAFLNFLNVVIPAEYIQKLSFFLIFFVSGVSAYKLCPAEWGLGRYFAGFLYMLNPFIYVRFLAGHWLLLLAYAITPLVVRYFIDFFKDTSTKKAIYVAFLMTFIFVLETHTPFLLLIVFSVFFLAKLLDYKKNGSKILNLSRSVFLVGIFLLILNSYWLFPKFIGSSTPLSEITTSDVYTFTTKQDFNFNYLFTTASMYGFWRGNYIYTKDLLPYWYLFFISMIVIAVYGFVSNYTDKGYGVYIKAFGAVAVLSILLATGISGPFRGVFEYLFNNVFFFKGFREPQKFVALLVLAYAYLGGSGVAEIEKIARDKKSSAGNISATKIVTWALVVFALIMPFVYSFTIFNGFWGQMKPTDYPKDWYEVNDFLNQDRQDFNVLFFPWHLYMDFHWVPNTDKRIANPASTFFDKPIIQGENMELGNIYSQSTNQAQSYVESLLSNRSKTTNFGEFVIPLNIKYVLLTKEVDYREYLFLLNQSDLTLIKETENFYVFKNSHSVSRFYLSHSLPPSDPQKQSEFISSLQPLSYEQNSPVEFSVKADAGYIMFVPPNLDSEYWEFDRSPPVTHGFYAIYPAKEGVVYYRQFDIFLVGYIVSLVTLIGLVIWYRKEALERALVIRKRISRRF